MVKKGRRGKKSGAKSTEAEVDAEDLSEAQKPEPESCGLSSEEFRKKLQATQRLIQKKDQKKMFASPITDNIAPGYSQLIQIPMDFYTINKNIQREVYKTFRDYMNDVSLVLKNCMIYNLPETSYYKTAARLVPQFEKVFLKELQIEYSIEIPAPRTQPILLRDIIPGYVDSSDCEEPQETESCGSEQNDGKSSADSNVKVEQMITDPEQSTPSPNEATIEEHTTETVNEIVPETDTLSRKLNMELKIDVDAGGSVGSISSLCDVACATPLSSCSSEKSFDTKPGSVKLASFVSDTSGPTTPGGSEKSYKKKVPMPGVGKRKRAKDMYEFVDEETNDTMDIVGKAKLSMDDILNMSAEKDPVGSADAEQTSCNDLRPCSPIQFSDGEQEMMDEPEPEDTTEESEPQNKQEQGPSAADMKQIAAIKREMGMILDSQPDTMQPGAINAEPESTLSQNYVVPEPVKTAPKSDQIISPPKPDIDFSKKRVAVPEQGLPVSRQLPLSCTTSKPNKNSATSAVKKTAETKPANSRNRSRKHSTSASSDFDFCLPDAIDAGSLPPVANFFAPSTPANVTRPTSEEQPSKVCVVKCAPVCDDSRVSSQVSSSCVSSGIATTTLSVPTTNSVPFNSCYNESINASVVIQPASEATVPFSSVPNIFNIVATSECISQPVITSSVQADIPGSLPVLTTASYSYNEDSFSIQIPGHSMSTTSTVSTTPITDLSDIFGSPGSLTPITSGNSTVSPNKLLDDFFSQLTPTKFTENVSLSPFVSPNVLPQNSTNSTFNDQQPTLSCSTNSVSFHNVRCSDSVYVSPVKENCNPEVVFKTNTTPLPPISTLKRGFPEVNSVNGKEAKKLRFDTNPIEEASSLSPASLPPTPEEFDMDCGLPIKETPLAGSFNLPLGFLRQVSRNQFRFCPVTPHRDRDIPLNPELFDIPLPTTTLDLEDLSSSNGGQAQRSKPYNYLSYGAYAHYAPEHETSEPITNNEQEAELLSSVYSGDVGLQFAMSLEKFTNGMGKYVSGIVDEFLSSLTGGKHGALKSRQLLSIPFDDDVESSVMTTEELKQVELLKNIGIDTSFLSANISLNTTASAISDTTLQSENTSKNPGETTASSVDNGIVLLKQSVHSVARLAGEEQEINTTGDALWNDIPEICSDATVQNVVTSDATFDEEHVLHNISINSGDLSMDSSVSYSSQDDENDQLTSNSFPNSLGDSSNTATSNSSDHHCQESSIPLEGDNASSALMQHPSKNGVTDSHHSSSGFGQDSTNGEREGDQIVSLHGESVLSSDDEELVMAELLSPSQNEDLPQDNRNSRSEHSLVLQSKEQIMSPSEEPDAVQSKDAEVSQSNQEISLSEEQELSEFDEQEVSRTGKQEGLKPGEPLVSPVQEQGLSLSEEPRLSQSEELEKPQAEEQEVPQSEEQESLQSEDLEMTQSEEPELSQPEEQEILPSEEQDISSSEEQDISPSEEQKISPLEEQKFSPSEEQEVSQSDEQQMSPLEKPSEELLQSEKSERLQAEEHELNQSEQSQVSRKEEQELSQSEEQPHSQPEQQMSPLEKPSEELSQSDEQEVTRTEEEESLLSEQPQVPLAEQELSQSEDQEMSQSQEQEILHSGDESTLQADNNGGLSAEDHETSQPEDIEVSQSEEQTLSEFEDTGVSPAEDTKLPSAEDSKVPLEENADTDVSQPDGTEDSRSKDRELSESDPDEKKAPCYEEKEELRSEQREMLLPVDQEDQELVQSEGTEVSPSNDREVSQPEEQDISDYEVVPSGCITVSPSADKECTQSEKQELSLLNEQSVSCSLDQEMSLSHDNELSISEDKEGSPAQQVEEDEAMDYEDVSDGSLNASSSPCSPKEVIGESISIEECSPGSTSLPSSNEEVSTGVKEPSSTHTTNVDDTNESCGTNDPRDNNFESEPSDDNTKSEPGGEDLNCIVENTDKPCSINNVDEPCEKESNDDTNSCVMTDTESSIIIEEADDDSSGHDEDKPTLTISSNTTLTTGYSLDGRAQEENLDTAPMDCEPSSDLSLSPLSPSRDDITTGIGIEQSVNSKELSSSVASTTTVTRS